MARYWVGGTGNWSDNTNHWSTSSGGAGGADVPTSSDDVLIDANSGFGAGGTITLDIVAPVCHDFTSNSGHTYSITSPEHIDIYGSITLEANLTISIADKIGLYSTALDETITSNGTTLNSDPDGGLSVFGIGGGWALQDNLTLAGTFYQENGTFDANDHNVTANYFSFYTDTGYTPTVIMGSGTWEATSNSGWFLGENGGEVVTITPETSTIKFTYTGASVTDIVLGGKTYNNIWITGTGSGSFDIWDSNTFNDLKIDAGVNVRFGDTTTTTVSSFTATGISGDLITINSFDTNADGLTQHTLSKSSGIVSCDYLDISNSNATGGASWYAGANSANTTNNDGWVFEDAPSGPSSTVSFGVGPNE